MVENLQWQKLKQTVKTILGLAKKSGASAAEAGVRFDSGLTTTVRKSEVETIEFTQNKVMGISVYFGNKKGTVTTTDLSDSGVESAVLAACQISKYTQEDMCNGLADKEFICTGYPDLDLYYPWEVEPEEIIDYAKRCEAAGLANPEITNTDGASFATQKSFNVYGNTHDFLGYYPTSRHSMNCILIGEKDGKMQRDYDYTIARDVAELRSPESIGESAAKRTVDKLGAVKIKTQKAKVLLSAEVATSLFGHLITAISGGNIYRKTSFLLDKVGDKIFPEWVQLREKPHLLKGLGSSPFDAEGVETYEKDIVSDGILKTYLLNSYSARKLGMKTTGNAGGIHNLAVANSKLSFEQLLEQMGTGFLVTSLIGQGVNVVTGDYSRGASGFWVENGKISYPVEEVTIAGKLQDMFQGIQAIGNDVENRSSIMTGSILLDDIMIAGS